MNLQRKMSAMNEKILVIEDEETLVKTLRYNLDREGYQVYTATDGMSGLELARSEKPDLLILDLLLPELDGLSVCRILRQEGSNVPILMLTCRDEEMDKVLGLELGADDYVTKPFSLRELLARVKALLRRVEMLRQEERKPEVISVGELTIDLRRHMAFWKKDEELELSPKEFVLLTFLARNRGMVLSRELILERVWGYDYVGDTRTVDVHIRWLREKIEEDPGNPRHILTVRGIGYRFEG